ncbi:MAG: HipA family kinase [Bryobacteraceae bacterium]
MPVNAVRFVRKMRGGAQAHLIEADDGHFYVVKFVENPQHRRILVNEMIASVLLDYLQIVAPETAVVQVGDEFLRENPEVHIALGTRRTPPRPGWHFGSRFPGDPAKLAVYDFLPDAVIAKVENLSHFLAVLVLDRWAGNADARQSVFLRARVRQWSPQTQTHPLKQGFVALMIDHGYLFGGPNWEFNDSPLQGLYFRPHVYESVRSLDDFQPWLDRVTHFPEDVIDQALKRLPPQWYSGEEDQLQRLMQKLMARRKRVPSLIEDSRGARSNPFPQWR